MDDQIKHAELLSRGASIEEYAFDTGANPPPLSPSRYLAAKIYASLTRLKNALLPSREQTFLNLLGAVGTCACLLLPDRPKWVRVERHAPNAVVLSENEPLVPAELPAHQVTARRYLHRLVAAEAARREVDGIRRPAPKSKPWVPLANAYLTRFHSIAKPSAREREQLFESLVREVSLRFYLMVRRLRKARQTLFDSGRLTNRDLQELWRTYAFMDIQVRNGLPADLIPEHLAQPENS